MPNQIATALLHKPSIHASLKRASDSHDVNYDYMVKTAQRESSFNPSAKARTSSAAGLFQFTEQTWLQMVKKHGSEFGLEREVMHIAKERDGRLSIRHEGMRNHILNLRHSPELASQMAARFTEGNKAVLHNKIGRVPTDGELYAAHFLGANGAVKLIEAMENNPKQRADRVFPSAARSNKPVFYEGGKALSVAQLYENLTEKFDNGIGFSQREMLLAAHNGHYGVTIDETGEQQQPSAVTRDDAMEIAASRPFQGMFFEANAADDPQAYNHFAFPNKPDFTTNGDINAVQQAQILNAYSASYANPNAALPNSADSQEETNNKVALRRSGSFFNELW